MVTSSRFVYSPRLFHVRLFLVVMPLVVIAGGCLIAGFMQGTADFLFLSVVIGAAFFIATLIVILLIGWPKKLYLFKEGLVIQKFLTLGREEEFLPYSEMTGVEVAICEVSAPTERNSGPASIPILTISLKDGKDIKLDFVSQDLNWPSHDSEEYKGYQGFLAELKKNILLNKTRTTVLSGDVSEAS